MITKILDFGSPEKVAINMEQSAVASETMAPVLAEIAVDMMKVETAVFASQGRRGGGSWKKLKPETIKRKGSSTILVNSGQLRDSVTVPGAANQILNITDTTLEFGTDSTIGQWMQEGNVKIPARPFLRFTPQDHRRWNGMILNRLTAGFRA